MNPYAPHDSPPSESAKPPSGDCTTKWTWGAFLNWFAVISLPAFLLTLFVGLGFALGPLRTTYNSPIRGLSLLCAATFLFAGPIVNLYMIHRNATRKQARWLIPQLLAAMGWAVIAYCLIGGIMGLH